MEEVKQEEECACKQEEGVLRLHHRGSQASCYSIKRFETVHPLLLVKSVYDFSDVLYAGLLLVVKYFNIVLLVLLLK